LPHIARDTCGLLVTETSSRGVPVKLYVPLTRDEFETLREIARSERRRPQDQAAVFVAKQLRQQQEAASPNRADKAAVGRK
jgi:hypothetical protein